MKIIDINYKVCEKTMAPILYGVVYQNLDFFNFSIKTTVEFIHDIKNNTNLVDIEDILKSENIKEKTSEEDLLDIYYLVKTDVKLIDDDSKKIINSWYLTRKRSIKFKDLGL
jgi:uncharacterized protein YfkK (UPF0435 family)